MSFNAITYYVFYALPSRIMAHYSHVIVTSILAKYNQCHFDQSGSGVFGDCLVQLHCVNEQLRAVTQMFTPS